MRHIRAAAIACALLVSTTVNPATTEAAPLAPAAIVHTAAEDSDASSVGSVDTDSLKLLGSIVALIGGIASLTVAVIKATPGAEDNIRNLIRG